jgi:hypothetical protein
MKPQPGTSEPAAGATTPAQLCNKADYAEGNTCLREITMEFDLKNSCTMDGTATVQVSLHGTSLHRILVVLLAL